MYKVSLAMVGIEKTDDLWDTSPMLCQLYMVKSVRVDDISELSLVPSISMYSIIRLFCVCWCYVLRCI
jgi:hypothetical protein